ncbi:hypothetical protein HaLaN_06151 [Haematococcus lacustris]|uniref:Uncharacterized protein n=1 Tax=Haematococcus lacustris TaxID=44745 RepID=A0A699YN86_HAELA|nr:hypothetical protein HaLaN_06151 [Haematococcus lacustris]
MACSNLKPPQLPLTHRTCVEAATTALACPAMMCSRPFLDIPAGSITWGARSWHTCFPAARGHPPQAPSATATRQLFLCPCELGQQPDLACSLRTCPQAQAHNLQLQPHADGSVMLTTHQYGKPSSTVDSQPAAAAGKANVELLRMRMSLSDVSREHREAVKASKDGKVVISCGWSEKLTVERRVETISEHWHAPQIGILAACAYFKNKEGAYKEQTVYVMTDRKEQSAAIIQGAVNQGRHGSEGGVVKQWLGGEILADCAGMCNASEFVQHCNAYHKPATATDPSKADRARASVGRRWCLELSTQEVELCSAPQRDAHAFASSIPGSMGMHSCFFPASGIQVEWPSIAKPFVAMPMFDQKRDDKHWDDGCLTLLCTFAPHSMKQLCTLGKKLGVKILNEYCKAVGLYVPAGTLRADLRYMCTAVENSASCVVGAVRQHFKGASRRAELFACLADCRSPWVPAARACRRKHDADVRRSK